MHHLLTSAQDGNGLRIRPVVDDRLQDIGVRAGRHRLEEAAGRQLAAIADPGSLEERACRSNHLSLVVQHAAHRGVTPQDGGEQGADATTDVRNGGEAAEVVRLHHSLRNAARVARHRPVERLLLRRPLPAVLPHRCAMDGGEGVLTGPHAVKQAAPRLPVGRTADEGGPTGHRAGHVRAQQLAELCVGEAPFRVLLVDAEPCEGSHQPSQGRFVGRRRSREVGGGAGSRGELVGDPQCRGDVQCLRDLEADDHSAQLLGGVHTRW